MKQFNKKSLLGAAVAGIVGAAILSAPAFAKDKEAKKMEMENCYGINKCAGHGKCGGEGNSCAGTNKCQGQGWLPVPKDLCNQIQGGSLKPLPKESKEAK